MLLRRFLKDSALYTLGSLLTRGLGLLLLPFYTRVLSPHDYGLIDLLLVFGAFVHVTIALEVSQGLARLFPEADDRDTRAGLASTAFWFTVAIYSAFASIGWWGADFLSRILLETAANQTLLRVALVSISLGGILSILQVQLRFQLRPLQHTITSMVTALVTIATTVSLVLWLKMGVFGVLYGQLLGYACGIALAISFVRSEIQLCFDRAHLRKMLQFSLPFVPSSIGVILALYIDRLVIKEFLSVADVGVYGVAYRFASAAGLLMLGFRSALTPLVYNHYREATTPLELARIFRLFVSIAIALVIAVGLFASDLVILLTSPEYYGAAGLIPLLVMAVLLSSMYIFAPGLSLAKKTGYIAAINIAAAIVNTLMNLALVPLLGTAGAALGTLVSALLAFTAYMSLSQRHYYIPHKWRGLVLGALPALGLFVAVVLLPSLPIPSTAVLVIKLLCLVGSLPLLAWGLLRGSSSHYHVRGPARQIDQGESQRETST